MAARERTLHNSELLHCVIRKEWRHTTFRFRGALTVRDHLIAGSLGRAVADCAPDDVLIDLDEVNVMDAMGLGLLPLMCGIARSKGMRISVVTGTGRARTLVQRYRLDQLLTVYDDLALYRSTIGRPGGIELGGMVPGGAMLEPASALA